ncbi:sigma-70 family RNA polymerase sigma factor [Paenibacillus kobensis]|uniref:sigma-70 family RNA polymerase sigma factor n=1 Tax=Paenibacillus kobensis TaxID=59841 RepID=UPI000FDBD498|nr:sigma-70 family RNA polymerase sigma factor [Paenibacillus kobensis]
MPTARTELQKLGDETRPYYEKFWGIITPYQDELWRYCRKLAGNPWDGEDLFQDTILKMFTSLSSLSHREQPVHPRAFLFRVATNHWIDICRKRKMQSEKQQDSPAAAEELDIETPLDIRDAFETLLAHLPPRQTVVLVLVDAFQFTVREAADIVGTTEGAVHAALFRARGTLRQLAAKENAEGEDAGRASLAPKPDPALVERYVSCFNSRDFQGIADLLADNAVYSFVTQSSKEYGKSAIMKASHNPSHYERRDLQAFVMELWGRQAAVFCKVRPDGTPEALNEVIALETEDDHIVYLSGYFFCPSFMEAAALQLGLPREEWQCAE